MPSRQGHYGDIMFAILVKNARFAKPKVTVLKQNSTMSIAIKLNACVKLLSQNSYIFNRPLTNFGDQVFKRNVGKVPNVAEIKIECRPAANDVRDMSCLLGLGQK